ncbi:hypothetical protein AB0K14_30355 [Actinosynnema sp. NPDC050801]|uniref:hypothetical protein n=1 Tax=unclassified Actinosynnema TaxID=2637065 RepID=UPI003411A05A
MPDGKPRPAGPRPMLITTDPPRHNALRNLISKGSVPRLVRRLRRLCRPRHHADLAGGVRSADHVLPPADRTAEQRRADDLISILMDAEVGGESLSHDELMSFLHLLLVAGNETTRNLIAQGTIALINHPEQLSGTVLRDLPLGYGLPSSSGLNCLSLSSGFMYYIPRS